MDKELETALVALDLDPADPLVVCAAQAALEISDDAFGPPFAPEDFSIVAKWTAIIICNVPAFMRQ